MNYFVNWEHPPDDKMSDDYYDFMEKVGWARPYPIPGWYPSHIVTLTFFAPLVCKSSKIEREHFQ